MLRLTMAVHGIWILFKEMHSVCKSAHGFAARLSNWPQPRSIKVRMTRCRDAMCGWSVSDCENCIKSLACGTRSFNYMSNIKCQVTFF